MHYCGWRLLTTHLLYCTAAGFMWAGYTSGAVALFHINKAAVAAQQLAVADATITALAVDPVSGLCWAGTEEGVVVIVRWAVCIMLAGTAGIQAL
jgi:hypothetical protein